MVFDYYGGRSPRNSKQSVDLGKRASSASRHSARSLSSTLSNLPENTPLEQRATSSVSLVGSQTPRYSNLLAPGPFVPGIPPREIWMVSPLVSSCPPGLENLVHIDQLRVKQKTELFEILTNTEGTNKYVVVNTKGQLVYKCTKESSNCGKDCCFSMYPFTVHVTDSTALEVLRIRRPYKYQCFWHCLSCSKCCQDDLEVEAPVGHVAGYVEQVREGCSFRYSVKDAAHNPVLRIHGPSYCHCSCIGQDLKFQIMSADGITELGRITKQWSGSLQDNFSNFDKFGLTFPMDLDVRIKATLIGAAFLVDFLFYGNKQGRNR